MIPRDSIEAAAATYLIYYRSHIAVEEADVLPRAGQMLTRSDWKVVVASGRAKG